MVPLILGALKFECNLVFFLTTSFLASLKKRCEHTLLGVGAEFIDFLLHLSAYLGNLIDFLLHISADGREEAAQRLCKRSRNAVIQQSQSLNQ
jgi:hypothetical protein